MDFLDILKLFLAVAMVILAIVAGILKMRDKKKSGGAWSEAARQTGLRFLDRGAKDQELRGEYRGYRTRLTVRTEMERRGRYNEEVFYTMVQIDAREPAGTGVSVRLRGENEVPQILRGQEDKSFAASFLVTGSPEGQHLFQDEKIRTSFLEIANAGDTLQLQGGRLKRERRKIFVEARELVRFLDTTIDIIDRLDIKAGRVDKIATREEEMATTDSW